MRDAKCAFGVSPWCPLEKEWCMCSIWNWDIERFI